MPSTDTPPQLRDPAIESIWTDGIGSGYHRGVWSWDVRLSHTVGKPIFGSTQRQDLWLGSLQVGVALDEPWLRGTPLKGNLEFVGLLSGGVQGNDGHGYLVSLAPGFRYDFATGTRLVPFVGLSAGAAITDITDPDLNGQFQFDVRLGGGLRWYVTPRMAVTFEYGLLHLSNGGVSPPAHGINTQMITVGLNCALWRTPSSNSH